MDWSSPLGTIIGGLIALAGGYFASRSQAKEQQRSRELQRRQERHDRLESIYIAILSVSTHSHREGPEEYKRLRQERIWTAFQLLASRQVLDAFERCSSLWYDYEPAAIDDDGSDEMKHAYDALKETMRTHLAEVSGGSKGAEIIGVKPPDQLQPGVS